MKKMRAVLSRGLVMLMKQKKKRKESSRSGLRGDLFFAESVLEKLHSFGRMDDFIFFFSGKYQVKGVIMELKRRKI